MPIRSGSLPVAWSPLYRGTFADAFGVRQTQPTLQGARVKVVRVKSLDQLIHIVNQYHGAPHSSRPEVSCLFVNPFLLEEP